MNKGLDKSSSEVKTCPGTQKLIWELLVWRASWNSNFFQAPYSCLTLALITLIPCFSLFIFSLEHILIVLLTSFIWTLGTQRVISFLRQIVEHGGFYRTTDQAWVTIERIQFVGACNPPTDPGRKPLSHRLVLYYFWLIYCVFPPVLKVFSKKILLNVWVECLFLQRYTTTRILSVDPSFQS